MSGNILRLARSPHQRTLEVLPWYLTGTLDADEQGLVELHLAQCPACRDELALERRVAQRYAASGVAANADAGLQRMRARLRRDQPSGGGWSPGQWLRRSWQGTPVWTAAALAAQLLLIGSLGFWLHTAQTEAPYRTLAATAPPQAGVGNAVLVFRSDATEQQMRRILRAEDARVVDGPMASGGFVVSIPPQDLAAALERLRREPQVTLAQALQLPGAP